MTKYHTELLYAAHEFSEERGMYITHSRKKKEGFIGGAKWQADRAKELVDFIEHLGSFGELQVDMMRTVPEKARNIINKYRGIE